MQRLIDWGFKRVGTFATDGGTVRFVPLVDAEAQPLLASTEPATYVWTPAGGGRPLYVGATEEGVVARMAGHRRGFRQTTGSKPGKRHAGAIAAEPGPVEIWVRRSKQPKLFGVTTSLHAAEELALIEALQPKWNKLALSDQEYAARLERAR